METDLIKALFAVVSGASEAAGWPGFLDRLIAATQADSALLRLRDRDIGEEVWQAGLPWAGPGLPVAERMRAGRVYSQVDLPGPDQPADPLRALRWTIAPEGVALLALHRRGEDFRAIDGLRLSNLAPYLETALAGWRGLRAESLRVALDRWLCHDFGLGWLLFTPGGRVQAASDGLAGRLQAAGIGLRPDGRLVFPSAQTGRTFQQALAGAGGELVLAGDPPLRLRLLHRPLAGEIRLVGCLRADLSARALPDGRILAGFDLSRSEARLAARLCDGMSLHDAAADLGWTLETTRSTSKAIYARMEARGQPEVVRRMLQSTIWAG